MPLSLKKLEDMVNLNYVGIIAAGLSIIISIYNIKKYYEASQSSLGRR